MAPSTELPKTVEWQGAKVPVYSMATVDFGRLLSQEPAELDKLVGACKNEGYFYLDLQNLEGQRMVDDEKDILALMHRYFESPMEAKNEFGLLHPHLGYEPVGNRTGVLADTKDGYEMFKVSRDEIQKSDPRLPAIIKNSRDMKILRNAIAGSNMATKTILSGLSTAMGLSGAARFENGHRNDRNSTSTMAMMHYIPSDPTKDKNVGHQKHTDISSLTLLYSEQWGLQVRPPGAREFGFVEPKPGCAFIHVGDSLRFASGHVFQSCIHRVVPFDPTEHRYSIAYFLRAEDDSMFIDSEGRYITAGQWHDEKFFAFTALPDDQAKAPPTMLLGGMKEEPEVEPFTPDAKGAPSPILAQGQETTVQA